MARNHKAGGQSEPHAARMGELLSSRHRQQGVSGTRQLHSDAVAPVVAVQAQNQASQGRNLSTPASLRALWARAPEQAWARKAWARRAVGEGVKFCPRAGCGKSACPVRWQETTKLVGKVNRTLLQAFFTSKTGQRRPSLAATIWAVAGSTRSCEADPQTSSSISRALAPALSRARRAASTARSEACMQSGR